MVPCRLSGKDGRGSGIIYCMSKKDCEQVSTGLRAYSIKAAVYHADLPQSIRDTNQKLWMDNEVGRAGRAWEKNSLCRMDL